MNERGIPECLTLIPNFYSDEHNSGKVLGKSVENVIESREISQDLEQDRREKRG